MSFEEFQDGRHDGHLGNWNGTILAILNLCVTMMLPIKFWFNPTYGLGEMKDGRYGGHLGYQNGTILTILNLNVAPMCPIKFRFKLTYGFGGDVV